MSSVGLTEPPTKGKVVLKTSYGDIDVELWADEAPLACRNFVQLALEGYFDKTIIHRVVKDTLVQMGDPTGTGTGGKSVWNKPYKDEIHSRLKFNHRGQVAMANESRPNSNHSQFFVTLGACEWLNRKHTIFGKVTGATIFNAIRMGGAEVDSNDRPVDEIRLLAVEVLWNPFDDIVPRDLKAMAAPTISVDTAKKERKATRDAKLLSFGEEEVVEEEFTVKVRSLHDAKQRDKRLSAKPAVDLHSNDTPVVTAAAGKKVRATLDNVDFDAMMRDQVLQRRKQTENPTKTVVTASTDTQQSLADVREESLSDLLRSTHSQAQQLQASAKNVEYQQLRQQLLQSRKAVSTLIGADADKYREEVARTDVLTPLEQQRLKYKKRKKELGDRADDTLSKLAKFTQSLRKTKEQVAATTTTTTTNNNSTQQSYHGQVLERDSDDDTDQTDAVDKSWHVGGLKFRKHIDDSYRGNVGADGRSQQDYSMVDSRSER